MESLLLDVKNSLCLGMAPYIQHLIPLYTINNTLDMYPYDQTLLQGAEDQHPRPLPRPLSPLS